MAGRVEHKYLVPNTLIEQIRADMLPYVEMDSFANKPDAQGYTVRSVYYDTPSFDCYDEKVEGIKVRMKFRIRGYDKRDEDSLVFLEIKRKYMQFIEKNRAPLLRDNLEALFSTRDLDKYILSRSGTEKEKTDAQRFFYHFYRHALSPAVLVIYDREPFFGKFDPKLRLTFDKNLRSTLFPTLDLLYEEKQIKFAMPKYCIFEVKFYTGLPRWIQSIIHRYELPRMALSKFVICMDSHKAPKKFARGLSLARTTAL